MKNCLASLGAALLLSIGAVAVGGCQLVFGIGGECPLEPTGGGSGGAGGIGGEGAGGTGGMGGETTTGAQGGGGGGGLRLIPIQCVDKAP